MKRYLYADESGNMDFRDPHKHPGASRYFAMGTMLIDGEESMHGLRVELESLRYAVMRERPAFDGYFHASEEKQAVRDQVFDVLQRHEFKVDVTIIEKSKTLPDVRPDNATFYKYAWSRHLERVALQHIGPGDDLMLVNASYGTKSTRKNVREAVEQVIDQHCPHVHRRPVGFWSSQADVLLQAADYVTWAVTRNAERKDPRSQLLIQDKITSIHDLLSHETVHFYGPHAKPAPRPAETYRTRRN